VPSSPSSDVAIRIAGLADARAVARLHANSWRRHYRGAYSDQYLDGDLDGERLAVWTARLGEQNNSVTLLAELDGQPVGFIHLQHDADPTWGSLVDNLHVAHNKQGGGIGTQLLERAMGIARRQRPASGVFLWVLEQNTAAQAFYLARGGTIRDGDPVPPPGGDPDNLVGEPRRLRVVWDVAKVSVLDSSD